MLHSLARIREERERERGEGRIKSDNLLTNKMGALIDSAKFTSLHGPHCLLKHNGPKRREVCAHFAEQAQVHSLNFVLTNYSPPRETLPPSVCSPRLLIPRLTIDSDRFASPHVQLSSPLFSTYFAYKIRYISHRRKTDVTSPARRNIDPRLLFFFSVYLIIITYNYVVISKLMFLMIR